MFKPKYQKEGKLLIKGVNRFLNYRRDRLEESVVKDIVERRDAFQGALKSKNQEKAEKLAKELTKVCEAAAPKYRSSSLAENIEVIFVAIAIALGIRAYIAQPFKIPTGSMQPTLNGIIAHSDPSMDVPNPVTRLFDATMRGRVWENDVAKESETVKSVGDKTILKFFPFTKITCDSGRSYWIFGPQDKAVEAFGVNRNYEKGDVVARGFVEMGDHVIVDKFSYHFFPPKRGEVFVFTTKDIPGIENSPTFNRKWGSQHYIKRLAGVPGDQMNITPAGELIINGEQGSERGLQRVMSKEDGYQGYEPTPLWTEGSYNPNSRYGYGIDKLERPTDGSPGIIVPDERYVALGDNSYHSSDSRYWGGVPKDNLVGRAFLVYWPFGPHWGGIR